jgi:hypothetical protein
MPSSTSSLSAEPKVSVVIGASASEQSLEACLTALEPQLGDAEVIVVDTTPTAVALRERFGWAQFHARPGFLVPELWRDGIELARGAIVGLTISQMVPAPDWVESIISEHEQHDAVGGAIDPGTDLRLVDWAEYFCRYAGDMPPFGPNDRDDLPGDNASYKRVLLVEAGDALRSGFWEPVIHPVLKRRGIALWHTPALLVRQGRSNGFEAFAQQRLEHGRRYGHQRGAEFTRTRNLAGFLAAPLVPLVMTARLTRHVFAKKRFRARVLAALPVIFALNAVWAYAEARGHLDMVTAR